MKTTGTNDQLKIYGSHFSATRSNNLRAVGVYVAARTLREASRVLRDAGYRIDEQLNRIHEESEPTVLALANPGRLVLCDFEESPIRWQVLPPPE